MSYEKSKLVLSHRLEKRRIWLNKTLVFATVCVIAYFAHWLGPRYAAKLREKELEHQYSLELAKNRQVAYYQQRIKAYDIIDSMYTGMLDLYLGALTRFDQRGPNPGIAYYSDTLGGYCMSVIKTLKRNKYYIDSTYCNEAGKYCIIYAALTRLMQNEWPLFSDFFCFLNENLSDIIRSEFEAVIANRKFIIPENLFRLTEFDGIENIDIEDIDTARLRAYIYDNFRKWQESTQNTS